MGKIFNKDANNSETKATFIDRTNESWYHKKNSNKVFFVKSIEDIIDGNAESVEFSAMETSVMYDKNAKGELVERNYFAVFTMADNTKILARLRDQIK
jgi:hypothetical protein